jgi:hypothetical protein
LPDHPSAGLHGSSRRCLARKGRAGLAQGRRVGSGIEASEVGRHTQQLTARLLSQNGSIVQGTRTSTILHYITSSEKLAFGKSGKILPEGQFREDRAAMNLLL